MKWMKFLQADGERKAGEVLQIEDSEAAVLKRLKVAEETAEPADVAKKATELTGSLKSFVEEKITQGIEAGFAQVVDSLKPNAKSKRPGIVVGEARELDDPTDGFKSAGDFYGAVRKACAGGGADERLTRRAKATGASENVNADGGYSVPVQYATSIFNDLVAEQSLMNDCFTIPMESNTIRLPAINYAQQGDAGGVTANWEGEGVSIPTSKPKFRQPQLTLNKLTVLVPCTTELLEDGIATEATINFLAAQAIAFKVNDAIFNGTGAGMPTGIIGHASTVAITRTTTSHFKAADAITMKARFISPNGASPKFYANQDVDPDLYTIQDPSGRYLYFAPGTFGDSPNGRLLGLEHRPTINCQSLGTAGDVVLADLKQYAFGYKSTGINKAMSMHVYFVTDELAYRWTFRADGRPWRDTTLKAAKGNNTYSSFVTIAA